MEGNEGCGRICWSGVASSPRGQLGDGAHVFVCLYQTFILPKTRTSFLQGWHEIKSFSPSRVVFFLEK